MTLQVRQGVWATTCGGAAYGLLWVGTLPGDLGHALFGDSLCGPWGCLPPLQALMALHGLWALALAAAFWAVRNWPPARLRRAGGMLAAAGLLGLGVVVGRDLLTWLPAVPTDHRSFIPQRILFRLATLTDLPVVQVTLAGLVWAAGRWRGTVHRVACPH